ncbi:MAG TPA: hypothetical protein VIE42_04585 [Steroidobacteraceae bacterium]
MKRFSAALVLTALAATGLAVAQQAPPPAEPPTSTSQDQAPDATTPPTDSSAGATTQSSSADKQQMMKDCLTQVTTANPGVPQKDIQDFCDKEVNKTAPPRN